MHIQMTLTGLENLNRIAARGLTAQKAIAKAMYQEATVVLNESKKIVPVDLGTLKNSGQVKKPDVSANAVNVDISYGGAAADYAFIVHENPNARHKPGKTYKYLEIPFMARKPIFIANLRMKFAAWMYGGK